MAKVQGEQVGLSLPRPLSSPPATWSRWPRFSEGSLHSRRAHNRNHQPLVGALARPWLGHLLCRAYDPRRRTLDRRPFLRSSRSYNQRTGATSQSRLGERARRSKDPDWHNSSGLWRRIRAVGSVICLALAHVVERNPFNTMRSERPTRRPRSSRRRRPARARRGRPAALSFLASIEPYCTLTANRPRRGLPAQPKAPTLSCPQSATYC